MRKREFMRDLESRLTHLDRAERENVLAYYDELIEDKIERTGMSEEQVIYNLGPLSDIARRASINTKRDPFVEERPQSRIKIDESDLFDDEEKEETINKPEEPRVEPKEESPKMGDFVKKPNQTSNESNEKMKKSISSDGGYRLAVIIILVLTSPFWFGAIVGLIGGIFGLIVGLFGAVIGLIGGGIGTTAYGVSLIGESATGAMANMGIGFICLGLAIILLPLTIKLVKLIIKLICKGIGAIWHLVFGKREVRA